MAPEEVDEIRIVHSWIAAHDPPMLSLDVPPPAGRLQDFVNRSAGCGLRAAG